MLLNKLANRLALRLSRNIGTEMSIVSVYAYGLELLLSALITILFMVIISFVFSRPFAWLCFLISFIPLRATAGGYHCKTHFRCILLSTFVFVILNLLYSKFIICPLKEWAVVCCLFNTTTVLLLSPVQTTNKPLNTLEIKQNKKRAILISAILLTVSCLSLLFNLGYKYSFLMLGVLFAAISQIAGEIRNIIERRSCNEKNQQVVP